MTHHLLFNLLDELLARRRRIASSSSGARFRLAENKTFHSYLLFGTLQTYENRPPNRHERNATLSPTVIRSPHPRRELGVELSVRLTLGSQALHRSLVLLRLHVRRQPFRARKPPPSGDGKVIPGVFINLHLIRRVQELERRGAGAFFTHAAFSRQRCVKGFVTHVGVRRRRLGHPARRLTRVRFRVPTLGLTFDLAAFFRAHRSVASVRLGVKLSPLRSRARARVQYS